MKTNLETSLAALSSGNDKEALAPAFQVSQGPGLTAPQLQLAKEVGNLASAFVVQRNFSSLSGAQGDVATLVGALRTGQYSSALPPLQKIYGNATLTPMTGHTYQRLNQSSPSGTCPVWAQQAQQANRIDSKEPLG